MQKRIQEKELLEDKQELFLSSMLIVFKYNRNVIRNRF